MLKRGSIKVFFGRFRELRLIFPHFCQIKVLPVRPESDKISSVLNRGSIRGLAVEQRFGGALAGLRDRKWLADAVSGAALVRVGQSN